MLFFFRFVYKRWDRKSIRTTRQAAQKAFDAQFPSADRETRWVAMNLLYENLGKYSLAQVLLNRQPNTAAPAADPSSPL